MLPMQLTVGIDTTESSHGFLKHYTGCYNALHELFTHVTKSTVATQVFLVGFSCLSNVMIDSFSVIYSSSVRIPDVFKF